MKVRLALGGCLLLLGGCRQPNPEWMGPGDGEADTATDPSTDPSTSSSTTAPETSGPPVDTTEGERCQNDNQCPDGWVCGPTGCQRGEDGDACEGDGDCQSPTAICGPEDMCQEGSAGQPCADGDDCMEPSGICGPTLTCQTGEAGQPCTSNDHCASNLTCTDDVCG